MQESPTRPEDWIPYGYQRKTKGKLFPGDQVWMPKYRSFRAPDTQAFSQNVRDYAYVVERMPSVPARLPGQRARSGAETSES